MKSILIAITALGLTAGAAFAQGDKADNSMNNTKAPGATGAMKTPTAPGVATNPQEVQAQQGDTAKQSAGTVGAAPMAPTNSQTATDKDKK